MKLVLIKLSFTVNCALSSKADMQVKCHTYRFSLTLIFYIYKFKGDRRRRNIENHENSTENSINTVRLLLKRFTGSYFIVCAKIHNNSKVFLFSTSCWFWGKMQTVEKRANKKKHRKWMSHIKVKRWSDLDEHYIGTCM